MANIAVSMVCVPLLITFFSFCLQTTYGDDGTWEGATATGSYKDRFSQIIPSGGGACGYGDEQDYGLDVAAASTTLFNNGLICGACYELKCTDDANPERCVAGASTVIVTATNLCPPNYALLPGSEGSWCNPPNHHFELTESAYKQIIQNTNGNVPISFRRATCTRSGGIKFTMNSIPFLNTVLITNVGGAGDVQSVSIKRSSSTTWEPMTREFGGNWLSISNLNGQSLSFQVTTSDGKTVTSNDVVPANWQPGKTYEGAQF